MNMNKYEKELSKFPILSDMEKIVYDRLFEKKDVVILSYWKKNV